jgi:hypothetical protein
MNVIEEFTSNKNYDSDIQVNDFNIQVNDFNNSYKNYDSDSESNWFLYKTVYFFFIVSCSGILYNYNQINTPK